MPKKTTSNKRQNEWKLGSIRDWIALTRAEHSAIVFIAIIASEFVVAKKISLEMIFPAIGPALITLGAFAWNDYFGIKTDSFLKRLDRPLVSGRVGRKTAFYGAIALFALGCVFASLVNQVVFTIALAFTVLSMLYDVFLKKTPLLGNAFIASSMSFSFLYGNYAVSTVLNHYVLLFIAISFFAGLGRELVITLRDVKGDEKIGAKTLPMVIGTKGTVILSSALFHLAVVISLAPFMQSINLAYLLFIGIADVLILISAWKLVFNQTTPTLKKIRNYTLYALMAGVIAFLALGL
ncbi:MAG: UbiA family prenyltransferase [Candidatus Micrarchaeota archaeon]